VVLLTLPGTAPNEPEQSSVTVSPSTLPAPAPTVGVAYSRTITASGGTGTFTTFQVSSGTLPPGLTLNSATATTVTLSGTPTADGTFNFTVEAIDSANAGGSQSYSLTVGNPTIAFAPASLPGGTVGAAYSQTITASGSTTPFHFTISAGALPTGLFLNQDMGVISGVPTTTSGSPFS